MPRSIIIVSCVERRIDLSCKYTELQYLYRSEDSLLRHVDKLTHGDFVRVWNDETNTNILRFVHQGDRIQIEYAPYMVL